MKKAQITVFVIVGLVLVIVFGLAFFIRGVMRDNPVNNQQATDLKKNMGNYVAGCLELITEQAISKALRQGGDLYDPNGDDDDEWTLRDDINVADYGTKCLPYDVTCVSYGIKLFSEHTLSTPYFEYDDDKYPGENYRIGVVLTGSPFGDNALPKLCAHDGPNRREVEREGYWRSCRGEGDFNNYDSSVMGNYMSIQAQLSLYIAEKLEGCADFKAYEKKGYDIVPGTPNITFIFGDSDIEVIADYPDLVLDGLNVRQRGLTASVKMPVKLKKFYEFVYELINKEISDLMFNAGDDYSTISTYEEGITVEWIRTPCQDECNDIKVTELFTRDSNTHTFANEVEIKHDHIIKVEDANTILDGRAMTYYFAVRNRRPVLDHIPDQNTLPNMPSYGGNLEISFKAIDPDDTEELIFSFSGATSYPKLKYDCGCLSLMHCRICIYDNPCIYGDDIGTVHTLTLNSLSGTLLLQDDTDMVEWKHNNNVLSTVINARPNELVTISTDRLEITHTTIGEKTLTITVSDGSVTDFQKYRYRCCKDFAGSMTENFFMNLYTEPLQGYPPCPIKQVYCHNNNRIPCS